MPANYLGETPTVVDKTPQEWALYFIERYGQIDGAHHKAWVLDQVARILNGTPVITVMAKWGPSDEVPEGAEELRAWTQDPPSAEYLEWVELMKGEVIDEYQDGDGLVQEREYDYDEGIAP